MITNEKAALTSLVLIAQSNAYREAALLIMDKAACVPSVATCNTLLELVEQLNAKASLCEMEAGG